jgi:hypothetical protein
MHLDGYNVFKQFEIVVDLNVQMRQQNIENDKDQRKFIELLPRCRTGQVTIDD